MNIYTNAYSAFPSQVVPDAEKSSLDYGRRVAQAIKANGGDKVVMVPDLLHLLIDSIH